MFKVNELMNLRVTVNAILLHKLNLLHIYFKIQRQHNLVLVNIILCLLLNQLLCKTNYNALIFCSKIPICKISTTNNVFH